MTIEAFIFRWFIGWAYLFSGIIRVLTLGTVSPNLVLPVAKAYARIRYGRTR